MDLPIPGLDQMRTWSSSRDLLIITISWFYLCLNTFITIFNKHQAGIAALKVPSDRPERWHHTWTLEAFRWLCTWPVLESDPGSPRTWWRSPWKQEAGWLLLPASTTQRTPKEKGCSYLGHNNKLEKVPAVFRWTSLWGRCRHICCHDNMNNS